MFNLVQNMDAKRSRPTSPTGSPEPGTIRKEPNVLDLNLTECDDKFSN